MRDNPGQSAANGQSAATTANGEARINLLERYGLQLLQRWRAAEVLSPHLLSAEDWLRFKRLERQTVFRAALAGAVAGVILGGFEVAVSARLGGEMSLILWREQLSYWIAFVLLIVVVSVIEIGFLYWNALYGVGKLSAIAGVELAKDEVGAVVGRALVRAALEMPNIHQTMFGINPYARTPRWRLVLWALLYRLKVSATSFLARIFLRRLLARAALRVFIPLVAIPVYAIWNAAVTGWVLRQGRVRALGPWAAKELAEHVSRHRKLLSEQWRQVILGGVAELMILTADAHPNYYVLLTRLLPAMELTPEQVQPRWDTGLGAFKNLTPEEKKLALTIFTVTVVIDGRIRRAELELLAKMYESCGLPFDPQAVHRLHAAFVDGRSILQPVLAMCGG